MNVIRTNYLIALFSTFVLSESQAQACHEIDVIQTATQRKALQQYVKECRKGGYLMKDKGIIHLTSSHNEEGEPTWQLSAITDDRHKANPTLTYSKFKGSIILVYQADGDRRTAIVAPSDKAAINSCLDRVIKNRVNQRPPIHNQQIEVIGADGKPRKYLVHTLSNVDTHNSKVFVFKSDGTYTILLPV